MRRHKKPVRKCGKCLLNLGDHCWIFENPRDKWRGRDCPGFENEILYAEYRIWQSKPRIPKGREIRRSMFRSRKILKTSKTKTLSGKHGSGSDL